MINFKLKLMYRPQVYLLNVKNLPYSNLALTLNI